MPLFLAGTRNCKESQRPLFPGSLLFVSGEQVVLHLLRAGLANPHEPADGTEPATAAPRSAHAETDESARADPGQGGTPGAGHAADPERDNSDAQDCGAALSHRSGGAGFREESAGGGGVNSAGGGGEEEQRSQQGTPAGLDACAPPTFCTIFFDTVDTFPEIRSFTHDLGARYGPPIHSLRCLRPS